MQISTLAGVLCAILAGAACTPPEHPVSPNMPPSSSSHSAAAGSAATRLAIAGPEASAITVETIARFPEPGWQIPRAIRYAPGGKLITYLQSEARSERMALFGFDVEARTSKLLVRASDLLKQDKPLSEEEELRRERQRQRTQGISEYAWAKHAPVILIPIGGDLFTRDAKGVVTRLTDSPVPAIDPKISDDGETIAFVRKGELVLLDVSTKKETPITKGAPTGVTRGLSDYLAQEEFNEPSGLWWSPSSDKVAFLEVDERSVEVVPVLGYRNGKTDLMQQRYPLPGARNATVKVAIVDVRSKAILWLKVPENLGNRIAPAVADGDRYLARFHWSPDGKSLWFQSLSRDQKRLAYLRADPATGVVTELWNETSPTWITFKDMMFLERSQRVVTTTVTNGHHHLELRDTSNGQRVVALTHGDWDAESIAGVDEQRGVVHFVGTMTSPVERHLYSVPLVGGEIKKITGPRGVHTIVASPDDSGFADVHSAGDRLPKCVIHGADGAVIGELSIPDEPDLPKLDLRTPQIVTVKSAAGDTLYGALLQPRTMEAGKKYPVIVMVYGGPGVQQVLDQWAPRLLWQHLADRGFVVFQLDNRGSSGRGPAFEAPIYKRLGEVELADQLAGVDYLKTLSYVDADRVGIYGHSYGGFMAALAAFKAPALFKVAVAGSPVAEWAHYDSAYTERYMDTPGNNPAGYERADLSKLAANLQGKLFLIHALMDENVHFSNSAMLVDALVAAGKKFDLFAFPGERHGYRSPAARKYAFSRVIDYFAENL